MNALETLLSDRGFLVAFGVGGLVVALAVVARGLPRRAASAAVGPVGVLAGLAATDRLPRELVVGVVLLALGAAVSAGMPLVLRAATALPGAALVIVAIGDRPASWVPIAAGVVTVAVAPLAGDLDCDHPQLARLLWAVSALGVYVTVPDTEEARALVGATLVAVVLGLVAGAAPERAGSAALAGVLAWTAAVDGQARPGAVVGALACLGVLVLGPVVRRAKSPEAAVLLVHVGLVALVSRVAGLRERASSAAGIAAGAYVVAVVALWTIGVLSAQRGYARVRGRGRAGRDG